jgi:hypothetical protein
MIQGTPSLEAGGSLIHYYSWSLLLEVNALDAYLG